MTRPGAPTGEKRECHCPRVEHRHGTFQAYMADGCRCFPCRVAHAEVAATYKREGTCWTARIDATGTQRRLRALYATGWTWTALAARLGVTREAPWQVATKPRAFCMAYLAEKVARLYDELSMLPPPEGWPAAKARRIAARNCWAPPLAWDDDTIDDPDAGPAVDAEPGEAIDEIAVQEAMHGRPVRLTKAERVEAVRRMTANGLSAREIGERLGTTSRTVQRKRSAA